MNYEEVLKFIWIIAFMFLLGLSGAIVTYLNVFKKEDIRKLRGELWKKNKK